MPVPTVSTITPDSGPTMGGVGVFIDGTNFRLSDPIIPAWGPAQPAPQSVRVTFGDQVVPWAQTYVISANRLGVKCPAQLLDLDETSLPVDVMIENIDDDGDPIVGESITVIDGFTYAIPDLSHANESNLSRLSRRLLRLVQSHVIPNVVMNEHPDYDRDTNTVYVDPATLPTIILMGPAANKYTWYQLTQDLLTQDNPGVLAPVLAQSPGRSLALSWEVTGISDRFVEATNLAALWTAWAERTRFITYTDIYGQDVKLEMDIVSDPEVRGPSQMQANSGVRSWTARIVIRGFQEGWIAGAVNDQTTGVTAPVDQDGVVLQPPTQL